MEFTTTLSDYWNKGILNEYNNSKELYNISNDPLEEENFDLIFTGLQSDDLGMGQTGVILGEMLGMTTASLVIATEVSAGNIKVKRELENGWFQWSELDLPASLTIQSGINIPRYATLKGIMSVKSKIIDTFSKDDIIFDINHDEYQIIRIFQPIKSKETITIDGTVNEITSNLVNILS